MLTEYWERVNNPLPLIECLFIEVLKAYVYVDIPVRDLFVLIASVLRLLQEEYRTRSTLGVVAQNDVRQVLFPDVLSFF